LSRREVLATAPKKKKSTNGGRKDRNIAGTGADFRADCEGIKTKGGTTIYGELLF